MHNGDIQAFSLQVLRNTDTAGNVAQASASANLFQWTRPKPPNTLSSSENEQMKLHWTKMFWIQEILHTVL